LWISRCFAATIAPLSRLHPLLFFIDLFVLY
jgi:hypothetical protein